VLLLHEQVRGILGTRRSSNGDDNGLKLAGNQRLRHQHIDLENSRDPSWRRTGVLDFGIDTIAYCRIGERSAHTWFVFHELLDQPNVKNYDGSWTEYGSLVGVPIELGDGS